MSKNTNDTSEELPTGTSSVSDLPEDFDVNGEKPTDGWVQFEKGKVIAYSLQFSDYVVTKEVNSEPTAEKNGTLAQNPRIKVYEIGDTVNYSTSLNGVTLDNWKVFYKEGDYVYLIYSDYLPNAAVNIENVVTTSIYSIYTSRNKAVLLNALTEKPNWSELVTNGTIDGEALNQALSDDVWAMGSPTIDLWVDSWNTVYPEDRLYTATVPVDDATGYGYNVGLSENPTDKKVDISDKDGYNNTLYFPRQNFEDDCGGYWLASPDTGWVGLKIVARIGNINYDNVSASKVMSARPVIRLPYSILN